MVHLTTGFGDGAFEVVEIVDSSGPIGFQIEFIKPGSPFPFSQDA